MFDKTPAFSASAHRRLTGLVGLVCVCGFLLTTALAHAQASLTGKPGVPIAHAVVNFSELAQQEALNPPTNLEGAEGEAVENNLMPPPPAIPADAEIVAEKPRSSLGSVPVRGPQPFSPPMAHSFLAIADNNTFIPPDTNGAVGPNHLVVTVNGTVRIQNRTGGTISSVTLHNFWLSVSGCTGQCEFDPKILYDPYGQRWIFAASANAVSASSEVLIGVSQTSDPTGSWNLYAVRADNTGTNWADFPSMGFNKDWIVATYNMFPVAGGSFGGVNVYIYNKANLYAGGAVAFTLANDINAFTLAPAVTYDTSVATEYLLQDFNGNSGGSGFLQLLTITGPVGSETLTTGPFISTPNPWSDFGPVGPGFAPQSGSANKIDTDDARLGNVVYRNGSLWTAHTIFLPAATPTRSSVQWWQLGTDGSIQQRGRVDDGTGALFRAYPSISVNKNNDALIGYSLYSSSIFASGAYSFRAGGDAANSLQSENVLKAGLASYFKTYGGARNRWGDYSYSQVDPTNDTDLWTIQEYADSVTNEWSTWWGELVFQSPTHFLVSAPATATAGSPFSATVTAQDALNNTVAGYVGTVHLSSSGVSSVPGDYTFVPGDNGVHTFTNGFTINTAGSQTVIATDAANALTGSSAPITVGDAGAHHYSLTFPPSATVGTAFSMRVVVQDTFNNTVKGYTGTVHFTSTGAPATLAGDYTYTGAGVGNDNGQHNFTNQFTATGGAGTTLAITAADTISGSINATTVPAIQVTTDATITPLGRNIHIFRAYAPLVVASFTDGDAAETGSNYTATINWGDGTAADTGCTLVSTGCKIVQVGTTSTFNVLGSHIYRKKGSFTVHVALTDSGGSLADAFSTARFFPISSSR